MYSQEVYSKIDRLFNNIKRDAWKEVKAYPPSSDYGAMLSGESYIVVKSEAAAGDMLNDMLFYLKDTWFQIIKAKANEKEKDKLDLLESELHTNILTDCRFSVPNFLYFDLKTLYHSQTNARASQKSRGGIIKKLVNKMTFKQPNITINITPAIPVESSLNKFADDVKASFIIWLNDVEKHYKNTTGLFEYTGREPGNIMSVFVFKPTYNKNGH